MTINALGSLGCSLWFFCALPSALHSKVVEFMASVACITICRAQFFHVIFVPSTAVPAFPSVALILKRLLLFWRVHPVCSLVVWSPSMTFIRVAMLSVAWQISSVLASVRSDLHNSHCLTLASWLPNIFLSRKISAGVIVANSHPTTNFLNAVWYWSYVSPGSWV